MAWDAAARESTPTPPDGDVHRPAFVNGNGPGARAGADEGTEQGAAAGVVHEAAQNATFVSGVRDTLVSMPGGAGRVLDGDNPAIKQEIIRMVAAYLEGEGYLSSAMTLMDEANVVGLPPKRLVCRWCGFPDGISERWPVLCGPAALSEGSQRLFRSGFLARERNTVLFLLLCRV